MSQMLENLIKGFEEMKEEHKDSTSVIAFLDIQIKSCREMIEHCKKEKEARKKW